MKLNLDYVIAKKTLLLIVIAYIFSIAVRLIWVYLFYDVEQFKFLDEFMINTNDGYYWAEGARDILSGVHQLNDRSAVNSTVSLLTAWFAKVFPLDFETIIFYMPAVLSSIIVIPIILIGKSLSRIEIGFIASLIASVAWSYYNRTMVGYYDSDMLNIVLPTFLLWSLIVAISSRDEKFLLVTSLIVIGYSWWYPQSYSLEFAYFGLIALFLIYQLLNKEEHRYTVLLLSFILLAMIQVDQYIRLIIIIALYTFVVLKKNIDVKYIYLLGVFAVTIFVVFGGVDPILNQLKGYMFRDSLVSGNESMGLHFYSVLKTVSEASQIPFGTFANRISGNVVVFLLAMIGYIWMVIRYPIMLLGLPMVGLGFLALSSGLRFTVYAIPVLALGSAFLIAEVAKIAESKRVQKVIMVILTVAVLYPNIKHVINYKVLTVFTKDEVKVLDTLKHIAKREDYVVSWWDYGYPIRYYSDVKTLIDGGKHNGAVNFPVSFALFKPQDVAAKMMRFDVEYTEKRFKVGSANKWASTNIEQMTLDAGFKDTNDFLSTLETDIKLPKKSRDIYLYLPSRMINILPTVILFSNLDLMTGKKGEQPFFYKSQKFTSKGSLINLGSGVLVNTTKGQITLGKRVISINKFIVTRYNRRNKLERRIKIFDKNSDFNVIYMQDYHQILVMSNDIFNSSFVQLFILDNYNPDFYEPVILTPRVKIYKLKV